MHRYKIVPPILLILSLINFLLAVPVVLQGMDVSEDIVPLLKSEKRWDKYSDEPWQKRGSSIGFNPAPPVGEQQPNLELATDSPPPSPPPPQTGTSRIQDAASVSFPEIKWPPSDTGILGVGSNDGGSPGPSTGKSYPPSEGPEPNLALNEGAEPGSIMNHPPSNRPPEMVPASTSPPPKPFTLELWDPHDWSGTTSEVEPDSMNRIKSIFDKVLYKFRFCCR